MNILRPIRLGPAACDRIDDQATLAANYADYFSDESKLRGDTPLSLSFPGSAEGVASVLAEHQINGETTAISAARSGVVGGAVPFGKTHLLSLERLKGISNSSADPAAPVPELSVLAGTTLSEIEEYLSISMPNWYYPVDPTYRHSAIGGNISTNASGMRTYYYGPTRDWIRGLSVVLSDGSFLKFRRGEIKADGGRLILEAESARRELYARPILVPSTKHSIGYHFDNDIDLVDLFIAAEGTLGVVVEAQIALAPRPRHRLYFLQFFTSSSAAFDFASKVQDSPLEILAVEYIDGRSLKIASTHPARATSRAIQALRPEFGAAVFLDVMLAEEEDLEPAYRQLELAVSNSGGDIEQSIAGGEDRDLADIKVLRHAVPEMINRLVADRKLSIPRLHKFSTDMSVPQAELAGMFDYYERVLGGLGLDFFLFGHFGNGHLHVNVVPSTEEELDRFLEIYLDFGHEVVRRGGAVAGEHGIGRIKKEFLKIQFGAEQLETMRAIRSFFDPQWLLNPGVLIDR